MQLQRDNNAGSYTASTCIRKNDAQLSSDMQKHAKPTRQELQLPPIQDFGCLPCKG